MTFLTKEIEHYGHALRVSFQNIAIDLIDTGGHPFDDIYGYDIKAGRGNIYGNSPRSLLLAFYALLKGIGVRFVAPNDERLPNFVRADFTIKADFRPKSRHRIVCIEGSARIEHVLAMIDFLLKIGMNGYFIQFDNPFVFFERYVEENDQAKPVDREKTRLYKKQIEEEIAKRELIYHAVGHGWTTRVLGLEGDGWHQKDVDVLADEQKQMIALKNGKRTFFKGIPLNTQLCYSDPNVLAAMTKTVVDYAKKHAKIDVLHVWLADDFNNFCECERCQKELPSAQYVRMLNAIDRELTKEKIDVKIAFLAYYELLEPSDLKIVNEDRFILMFAPITRTYLKSFKDVDEFRQPQKQSGFPTDLSENLGYLKAWQSRFHGDCFLFDYHLMWDGFKEPTGLGLSQTLYADLTDLPRLGLNGLISCQLTRNAFPHALALGVMGRALVEGAFDLEEQERAAFKDAFEEDDALFYDLFKRLYSPLIHAYMRRETAMKNQEVKELAVLSKTKIEDILEQRTVKNEQNKIVLIYLYKVYHIVELKASGFDDEAKKALENLLKTMESKRHVLDDSLDYFYMNFILNELITT